MLGDTSAAPRAAAFLERCGSALAERLLDLFARTTPPRAGARELRQAMGPAAPPAAAVPSPAAAATPAASSTLSPSAAAASSGGGDGGGGGAGGGGGVPTRPAAGRLSMGATAADVELASRPGFSATPLRRRAK